MKEPSEGNNNDRCDNCGRPMPACTCDAASRQTRSKAGKAMKQPSEVDRNDLLDISERLRTQDNQCTAEPMFCLQIKVRDTGYDPNYAADTVWINMQGGDYEEVPPQTPGAEEFGYQDRWETVMVAFTQQGLLDYMDKDGHNVKRRAHNGETRIYVESFMRCDEMIRVRQALMSSKVSTNGKDNDETAE